MTQRQVLLAWEEVQADQRRRRRERITDINVGFAGGKSAKQLIKDLE